MKGIPVERPDDMETAGLGFVTVEGTSVKVQFARTINSPPLTQNLASSTLNPQPSTLNTQHSTLNTQHSTLHEGTSVKVNPKP